MASQLIPWTLREALDSADNAWYNRIERTLEMEL
jgi:hypothetical protein